MMLFAFGQIGFAMRRRRTHKLRVRFALQHEYRFSGFSSECQRTAASVAVFFSFQSLEGGSWFSSRAVLIASSAVSAGGISLALRSQTAMIANMMRANKVNHFLTETLLLTNVISTYHLIICGMARQPNA